MFEHTQQFETITFDYATVKEVKDNGAEKVVVCVEDGKELHSYVSDSCNWHPAKMLGIREKTKFRGNGVSWCAICDGAQYRDRDVVVISSRNSAVRRVYFLAGMVKSVTIVFMFDLTADPFALINFAQWKM